MSNFNGKTITNESTIPLQVFKDKYLREIISVEECRKAKDLIGLFLSLLDVFNTSQNYSGFSNTLPCICINDRKILGLCFFNRHMMASAYTTRAEMLFIKDLMERHAEMLGIRKEGYWFKEGLLEPRVEFLKSLLNKLKNE